MRHLELFPVEAETASYATLLRVPGIGPKSASRITYARRYGRLTFESLKKMGVVLKRAHYFITCGGKQMYHTPIEEAYITRQLIHAVLSICCSFLGKLAALINTIPGPVIGGISFLLYGMIGTSGLLCWLTIK